MGSIELVDFVNSNGEVLKTSVPRSEAEKSMTESLHIPIVIAVIRNSLGEVLVHERAEQKRFSGEIDHVCGAISTGEEPETAMIREIKEEVGVVPTSLEIVRKGVNVYGYYCYLFAAYSDEIPPTDLNPTEVAWADYVSVEDLRQNQKSGAMKFVEDFFIDLDAVLSQSVQ